MNQTVILTNEQNKVFKRFIKDTYYKRFVPQDMEEIKIDKKDAYASNYHIWVFDTQQCEDLFNVIASNVTRYVHPTNQHTSVRCAWDSFSETFVCEVDIYPEVNGTIPREPIQTTRRYLNLQLVFDRFTTM